MAIQGKEETQDHLVFRGKRVWLVVKVLMVQRVIQARQEPQGIKALLVFRECLEREAWLEPLAPKVIGAA